MRQTDTIIRQLSQAKRDLEEIKTAQFTGAEQIKIRNIVAPRRNFTPTAMFQSQNSTIKAFKITARAENLDPRNVLLVYPVIECWQNGTQLLNFKNGNVSYEKRSFLYEAEKSATERSWVFVVIAPRGQSFELRTQFFASAEISYNITELN